MVLPEIGPRWASSREFQGAGSELKIVNPRARPCMYGGTKNAKSRWRRTRSTRCACPLIKDAPWDICFGRVARAYNFDSSTESFHFSLWSFLRTKPDSAAPHK